MRQHQKNIELRVEQQGELAKIAVTDFGPGIIPEKLPHLFERFYRADYSGSKYSWPWLRSLYKRRNY